MMRAELVRSVDGTAADHALYAIHDALVRPYPRHPGQKIGPPGAGDFPAYQKRRARSHARPLES